MALRRINLLAILEKNQNRTIFLYILKNFRMQTIGIEALTPLDRASGIEVYKNNARSRLFRRIARSSFVRMGIFVPFTHYK